MGTTLAVARAGDSGSQQALCTLTAYWLPALMPVGVVINWSKLDEPIS